MHYIRKLPLILALAGALITGVIGYIYRLPDKENMFRMTIVMIMFFITGSVIRNTVTGIIEENRKKQAELEHAKNKAHNEETGSPENAEEKGRNLDISIDDTLNLNENEVLEHVEDFIKNQLNQE